LAILIILIMQYLCPLTSSLLQPKRPSFTPIQNCRQNYRFVYFNLYSFR
jgi:hypothetical protein